MYMKITEYVVTTSVVNLLNTNNWEILSVNTPFSGKSVWIKPIDGYRGKGTLIPDIIARKKIIKGIAYANTLIKYNYPNDLIVFIVEDSDKIKIFCNKETVIKNEFNNYFNFPLEGY